MENNEKNITPYESNWDDDPDFDLMKIASEIENQQAEGPNPSMSNVNQNLLQQRNSLMFAGCKIGNITINITKQ